jgi:sugar phosphate isomerase/epimerase
MMKTAICHYSYHRIWDSQGWDCLKLAETIGSLGVDGIDFHARLLGDPADAAERIRKALQATGLTLSGLSLSTNFNHADPEARKREEDGILPWLRVAADVKAPVSRIFGGHMKDRSDRSSLQQGLRWIVESLKAVAEQAEKLGVVLALENHGGLPCTGQEQIEVIRTVNSPALRATVDLGNYLVCGQEGVEGTRIAAEYAAYVHVKDCRKVPDGSRKWGWRPESCVLGRGDVDIAGCLAELRKKDYQGFLALEYEAEDNELTGVAESIQHLKTLL